jgi:hypothetical protein
LRLRSRHLDSSATEAHHHDHRPRPSDDAAFFVGDVIGHLVGITRIESLRCRIMNVRRSLEAGGGEEDVHRCMFARLAVRPPMPSFGSIFVGESRDDGCLLGLINMESLHCLLPKPGLLDDFAVEVGQLLLARTASPFSQ